MALLIRLYKVKLTVRRGFIVFLILICAFAPQVSFMLQHIKERGRAQTRHSIWPIEFVKDPFRQKAISTQTTANGRMVHSIDCKEIINNKTYLKQIKTHDFRDYVDPGLTRDELKKFSSNCDVFRSFRGYTERPLSLEEAEFPIAFSIIVFRDIGRVERLIRAIYQPQNFYCIHVDRKTDPSFMSSLLTLQICLPGVFLSSRNVNVRWGHYTVLHAELLCMEDLLKRSSKWKYFINLTGQEFPLRTNNELVQILKVYNGANDIAGYSPRDSLPFKKRVSFVHRLVGDGSSWYMTRRRKAPIPFNASYVKGRVHITATRDFVDFAVHDEKAKILAEWLKDTAIPDESFFQFLQYNVFLGAPGSISNSSYKPQDSVNRYKIFRSKSENCHGKYSKDICIFGLEHFPHIYKEVTSGLSLFVNKFHSDYQPLAYDCLEEFIHNRTRTKSIVINSKAYHKLSFVDDFMRLH